MVTKAGALLQLQMFVNRNAAKAAACSALDAFLTEIRTAPKTFPSEKKCSRCTPHWQCLRFKIHTEVVLRVGFISYTLTSYRLLVTLRISFDFNPNCPPPSSSTYTSGHKDSLLAGRPSAAPPPLMALTVCWSQTHGSRRSAWDKEFHYECSVSFGCQLLLQELLAY